MPPSEGVQRYNWAILQTGSLPLRPDRRQDSSVDHRCTVALVWPADAPVSSEHPLLMTDPCFTSEGFEAAKGQLRRIGAYFEDIGHIFVTHLHADHMLHIPYDVPTLRFRPFRAGRVAALADLDTVHCPGHHPLLLALTFTDSEERAVWVVGDAVLDEEWLRAWQYYWPNGYQPPEIIETWRSVARILAGADVIVPGHGGPIEVSPALVSDLLASFPRAAHADQCPDVAETLRARLADLAADGEG